MGKGKIVDWDSTRSIDSASEIVLVPVQPKGKPSKGLRFWLIFLAVSVSLFLSALEYVSFCKHTHITTTS